MFAERRGNHRHHCRWKALRLLMAQYASNQTASWAASIMASVGLASGFKARSRQPSISGRIGLEVTAIGFGNGAADEINHAPDVGCASSWHGR